MCYAHLRVKLSTKIFGVAALRANRTLGCRVLVVRINISMATISRTSGINTALDTDYYVDVNLQKFRIYLENQNLTNDAGVDGGASHLIVALCKPRAYRIKVQGGHTYIFIIVEGAHADKSTAPGSAQFLQTRIRELGNAVGPNNIDCTGAIVSDETLG